MMYSKNTEQPLDMGRGGARFESGRRGKKVTDMGWGLQRGCKEGISAKINVADQI